VCVLVQVYLGAVALPTDVFVYEIRRRNQFHILNLISSIHKKKKKKKKKQKQEKKQTKTQHPRPRSSHQPYDPYSVEMLRRDLFAEPETK